jgi:hypothetical protein
VEHLAQEDKRACAKVVFTSPEQILKQLQETKLTSGQWIAIVVPNPTPLFLEAPEQDVVSGVEFVDAKTELNVEGNRVMVGLLHLSPRSRWSYEYDFSFEPKKIIEFSEMVTPTTKVEGKYRINDSHPTHLRESFLCSRVWTTHDETSYFETHEQFYDVSNKTIKSMNQIQRWVTKKAQQQQPIVASELLAKLEKVWGPLDYPVNVEQTDKYEFATDI